MYVDEVSPLSFKGTSGKECESFIHAVHNISRSRGRSDEDNWVVDLVRASFVGPALRWYAELPRDVQTSWRALRRALLRHYRPDTEADGPGDRSLAAVQPDVEVSL